MRYFFHLEDGTCIRDPKGSEFPDDATAMAEAANVARELSQLAMVAYEWTLVVKNADGIRVGSARLMPDPAAHGLPMPPRSLH